MLKITVPSTEYWDETKEEFVNIGKEQTLQLEHSLVSISKWESKWHVPFLNNTEKTYEQIIDYVRCMTITQNVSPDVYKRLTIDNVNQINDYIGESMTATTFSNFQTGSNKHEIVTSELVYYWMITYNIPMECQKWHINRLLTLIRICNVKNSTPKKMSRRDIMKQYSSLNAARRKSLHTKG